MIIERIKLTALPAARQQFSKALASLTGPIGVLPGCLSCSILQCCQDGNVVAVEVEWEPEEHLFRHLRSDIYKQLLLLMELSPKPPMVQFYTVQEVRGLDLVEVARNSLDTP